MTPQRLYWLARFAYEVGDWAEAARLQGVAARLHEAVNCKYLARWVVLG